MTLRTLLVKLGFKGDISKLVQFNNKITSLKSNVIGLSAVFATAAASLGYFVGQAAKMERIQISFKVLARGIATSKKLLKDILEFAAETPFEIPNVLETTKSLLAFGIKAKDMVKTMQEVGDVAAGMDKPLNILAQSYGRVMASGRLLGRVLYNLRLQGVPITEYLLKITGEKSIATLQKLVSQGKITADVFSKAWDAMRKERFMDVLFEQAQTFLGILSNIKDQITLLSISIGSHFLPQFKTIAWYLYEMLKRARVLVEDPKKMEGFVNRINYLMNLMNKSFIKIYYRLRETIDQFGGINKVLKAFAIIIGTFASVKTLALLGKLSMSILGIFNIFSHWKLTLLGASIILLIGAIEDFLAFLAGKDALIGRILNKLENDFPKAFANIKKWLNILKSSMEVLSLFIYAVFTGNIDLLKKALEDFSKSYREFIKPVITQKIEEKKEIDINHIPYIMNEEQRKKLLKKLQDKYGETGGYAAQVPLLKLIMDVGKRFQDIGRGIGLPIGPGAWYEKMMGHRELPGKSLYGGINLQTAFPININVTNHNNTMNEKELSEKMTTHFKPTVIKTIDELLKSEAANLYPKEY